MKLPPQAQAILEVPGIKNNKLSNDVIYNIMLKSARNRGKWSDLKGELPNDGTDYDLLAKTLLLKICGHIYGKKLLLGYLKFNLKVNEANPYWPINIQSPANTEIRIIPRSRYRYNNITKVLINKPSPDNVEPTSRQV